MAVIKDEIIEYRAKHNMSMRKLAEKANISIQTLWSVEHGAEPSRLVEAKIRLALKD